MRTTGSDKKFKRDVERVEQALALLAQMETDTLSVQQPRTQAQAELENILKVMKVYIERPDLGVVYTKGTSGSVRVIANRAGV